MGVPTGPTDIQATRRTANSIEELVKLNRESSKQTMLLTWLTILIVILTLIMALPIIKDCLKWIIK